MILRNHNAFAPFRRHTLQVVCKGASHTYRDAVQVAIISGQSPASGGPVLSPQVANQFTVIIAAADWRAEFPPAIGTTFTSDDFAKLTVQQVNQCADAWHCICTQNMRART